MSLYVFDRDETLVAVLEQADKNACSFWNGKIKRVLNGETTLTFTCDYSHPDAKKIVEYGYIAVENKYKKWELFLITHLEQKHTTDLEMDVTAEASYVELDGVIISNLSIMDEKPETALPKILEGTRWQTTNVLQGDMIHEYTDQNVSVLTAVQNFRDQWGVELNFYITVSGNKISGRFVDCYTQMGSWKGKRFEWTKDLTEVDRTVDATSLKTALIGFGNAQNDTTTTTTPSSADTGTTPPPMDFTSVTWQKASGDPVDKPSGQNWIGNPDALAIYGKDLNGDGVKDHIFGVYQNQDATSPADLLNLTWDELQTLSTPNVTYTTKTVDLYRLLGMDTENVDLGDTVAVIDRDLNIEIQARVIEQDEDLDYPENDESVLGNFLPAYTGTGSSASSPTSFEALKNQVNSTGAIDPIWMNTEFGFARDAIRSGNGTVIMNDNDGILIIDDPTNPQKAIRLLAGQLALANTRDLSTGEFNWRTFGTGDGFLADLVETGYLKFDRSQGGTLQLGGSITGYKDETSTTTVTMAGKANGDGDNSRLIYYSYGGTTTEGEPTDEVVSGYAGCATEGDGSNLYYAISNTTTTPTGVRYVRDYLNGSTANAYNYWNSVKALTASGTDRALGLTATISSGTLTNVANITDGNDATYGYESSGDGVQKYVQVDLGAVYTDVTSIQIIHFYADGRTFHGNKTQYSADGVNWTTLYDSAVSGDYVETSAGKTYTVSETATTSGATVGNRIQYMIEFDVSLDNLTNVSFLVDGTAGQPFTLRPWNYTLGEWDTGQTVTFDGSANEQIQFQTTDFATYFDADGNCRFSIYTTNALTTNGTLALSIDYLELDLTYYVDTVPTYQQGVFQVLNQDGDIVAQMTGDSRGFDQLFIGELSGNNVMTKNDLGDTTYYFDPTNGVDTNDGLTTSTPTKTIQKIIDNMPKINFDTITITTTLTGVTFVESVVFEGFMGSGTINLALGSSNIMKGEIDIHGCQQQIQITTLTDLNKTSTNNVSTTRAQIINQNTTGNAGMIHLFCNTYVYIADVILNANNLCYWNILSYDTFHKQSNCEMYLATTGTTHLLYGATCENTDCSGQSQRGLSATGACTYGGSGRQPVGTSTSVYLSYGAQCDVTFTTDAGTPPAGAGGVTQTTSWKATDTKSWNKNTGWASDYVYQGKRPTDIPIWFGCFFFTGSFSALSGKTISKVRLLLQRTSNTGDNTTRYPYLYTSAQSSASGSVTTSELKNKYKSTVGYKWGDSKWITLPTSFGTALQNGSAKSIVLYDGSDTSNYMRFEAKATLEITYS